MQIYIDYIMEKAKRLIQTNQNPALNGQFLLPIGIETSLKYEDMSQQINRLKELYQDGRDNRGLFHSNMLLYENITYFYVNYNELIKNYSLTPSAQKYYNKTIETAHLIPGADDIHQNYYYEIVFRNLLILAENMYGKQFVDLTTTGISMKAFSILCRTQINELFQVDMDNYIPEDIKKMISFAMQIGGLPKEETEFIEKPNEKKGLKSFFSRSKTQIPVKIIKTYKCNYSHLFYALLLTMVVYNLEVNKEWQNIW